MNSPEPGVHNIPPPNLLSAFAMRCRTSTFSWPAWFRVMAVLPVCAILWLAVAWALAENIP